MRTLALTQNVTVDGRIEMLDDWFDPTTGSDDLLAESHRQDAAADALLVGRQTFTDFRGFWRDREPDRTGVSDYLNQVAKYVVSSTLGDPDWSGTTVLGADWQSRVRALKEDEGRDIVCTGSIRLCHALLDAGLVDEVRLFVYPAVQGRGAGLFPDGLATSDLRLVESAAFECGVAFQRWVLG